MREKSHSISFSLNENTDYVRGKLPMKIFIIERVASFLLSTMQKWKVKPKHTYHDMNCNINFHKNISIEILHELDALKIAYKFTGNTRFIDAHNCLKKRLIEN